MIGEDVGIIVVDDDEEFLDETKRALDGKVPTVRFLTDAQRRIDDGSISVVVLGPSFASEPAMESAAILGEEYEDLGILLVTADIAPNVLRAAMRAGVRDVIEPPLTEERLNDAVAPIRRRRPVVEAAPSSREGKVVTVMSPKGGSGKTVIASNLAVLLAQQLGDGRVALVDADLQFGDDSLVLQLEPRLTVVNIVHDIDRLDEALVDSVLARHPSGLRVLPAPLEPAYADEISLASMIDIIGVMRSMFEVVVVDTSSSFDEMLLSILERSDFVLIVVDMDLLSVKNAKLALDTLRLLKFPSSKIRLVLNRANARARLDEREIEKTLGTNIAARIPSDAAIPASVNEGRPVVLSSPKSKTARGFEEVAALITGTGAGPVRGRRSRWR
ncbi:MAG TPA: AAA family ATPase [Acidimicrobiia bacterium]|jgi:pilus assembly protein CpaE|nr:AAA family ATPase [Acidimicrobiia bacterium]